MRLKFSAERVVQSHVRNLSSFTNFKVDKSYDYKPVWKKESLSFQDLVTLAKHRGFIFPGSEPYGGLKGTFDYGPLGIALKRNIMKSWNDYFVQTASDVVPLDSAITLHPKVWKVAGHVDNFTDPLIECKGCHVRYRVDKMLEDKGMVIESNVNDIESWTAEVADKFTSLKFKCTSCGARDFTQPRPFNLLMETSCGSTPTYLRPETAQGVFLNYERVKTATRKQLPFGIGQIGKAFRNEISPRDFLYRMREFEQMELEYFCAPEDAPGKYTEYVSKCYSFLRQMGIPAALLRMKEYPAAELAHYALATTDIEFHFPFGWGELWGIANRGDYDLRQHGLGAITVKTRAQDHPDAPADRSYPYVYYPHVVEPSVGVDRLVLAVLHAAAGIEHLHVPLEGDQLTEDKPRTRSVMHLHPDLAPIRVAVLPLVARSEEQQNIARDLFLTLANICATDIDTTGSIGKRYARQDEIGTPWCISIDDNSSANGTVTVRSRDSREQVTMGITELVDTLRRGDRLPL